MSLRSRTHAHLLQSEWSNTDSSKLFNTTHPLLVIRSPRLLLGIIWRLQVPINSFTEYDLLICYMNLFNGLLHTYVFSLGTCDITGEFNRLLLNPQHCMTNQRLYGGESVLWCTLKYSVFSHLLSPQFLQPLLHYLSLIFTFKLLNILFHNFYLKCRFFSTTQVSRIQTYE